MSITRPTSEDDRTTALAALPFLATLAWAGLGVWALQLGAAGGGTAAGATTAVVLVPALAAGLVTGPLAVLALLTRRARPCRAFAAAGAVALAVASPAPWGAVQPHLTPGPGGVVACAMVLAGLLPVLAVVADARYDTPQQPPASHQSH